MRYSRYREGRRQVQKVGVNSRRRLLTHWSGLGRGCGRSQEKKHFLWKLCVLVNFDWKTLAVRLNFYISPGNTIWPMVDVSTPVHRLVTSLVSGKVTGQLADATGDCVLKADFHYAIWSQTGSKLDADLQRAKIWPIILHELQVYDQLRTCL